LIGAKILRAAFKTALNFFHIKRLRKKRKRKAAKKKRCPDIKRKL
jgi:hypothetical protein